MIASGIPLDAKAGHARVPGMTIRPRDSSSRRYPQLKRHACLIHMQVNYQLAIPKDKERPNHPYQTKILWGDQFEAETILMFDPVSFFHDFPRLFQNF